jgi:hypothetical protein
MLDESVIPKGIYCHDEQNICPYWSSRKDEYGDLIGCCKYLDTDDEKEEGLSLLFEQCKMCGINEDLDEEV